MIDLTNPIFHDDNRARQALEQVRWPHGPVCPHCGANERIAKLKSKSVRPGLYYCNECSKQFSVTVGTVFERSKIGLAKWWMAVQLMSSSKKGMSAHQLHRMLGVTYKTAWFMAHRIRAAMSDLNLPPMGGDGEQVQVDETYFGQVDAVRGKPWKEKKGHSKKMSVVSLVHGGKARTFHVERANAATIRDILFKNVRRNSTLVTDESRIYTRVGEHFASHKRVHHAKGKYVVNGITTNHVENYFSVFKRGMKGVYQHCGEKHLHRYLAEFDFRYNRRKMADSERATMLMQGISGKRLTYRPISAGA